MKITITNLYFINISVDKVNKSQARKFNDLCATVQNTLTEKERVLKQKTQAPIPRSKEVVNRLLAEQRASTIHV